MKFTFSWRKALLEPEACLREIGYAVTGLGYEEV